MLNTQYYELLQQNVKLSKVRELHPKEWREVQKQLLTIELGMSAKDIIHHAETLFPYVQP